MCYQEAQPLGGSHTLVGNLTPSQESTLRAAVICLRGYGETKRLRIFTNNWAFRTECTKTFLEIGKQILDSFSGGRRHCFCGEGPGKGHRKGRPCPVECLERLRGEGVL